ncbi:unnamed protein product [Ixodes persulcatus]
MLYSGFTTCAKDGRAPRCSKRLPVALVMFEKQAKDISSARPKLPSAPSYGRGQLPASMQSKLRALVHFERRSKLCTRALHFI